MLGTAPEMPFPGGISLISSPFPPPLVVRQYCVARFGGQSCPVLSCQSNAMQVTEPRGGGGEQIHSWICPFGELILHQNNKNTIQMYFLDKRRVIGRVGKGRISKKKWGPNFVKNWGSSHLDQILDWFVIDQRLP